MVVGGFSVKGGIPVVEGPEAGTMGATGIDGDGSATGGDTVVTSV